MGELLDTKIKSVKWNGNFWLATQKGWRGREKGTYDRVMLLGGKLDRYQKILVDLNAASLYSFCWWGKVCKQKLCLVWLGDAPRIWHEKVPWWQEHVKLLKSTIIYQAFVLWCWTFLFGFAALLFKSLAPRCGLWDFFQIMPLSGNGKAPWGCFELDAILFLFHSLLHSDDESGKG